MKGLSIMGVHTVEEGLSVTVETQQQNETGATEQKIGHSCMCLYGAQHGTQPIDFVPSINTGHVQKDLLVDGVVILSTN